MILAATFIDGLIGLVGAFTLFLNEKTVDKIIFLMVGFSAGAMLAGGLFHMLTESLAIMEPNSVMLLTIFGFVVSFIFERYLLWHHCHEKECKIHPMSYLVIAGDGLHNIVDGLVIGASFLVSSGFGITTTLLILVHEIPQELGNFAVLVYGGMNKKKALAINFLTQLTCVIGGILTFVIGKNSNLDMYILPFAAGGFLYIAASDLVPQLHEKKSEGGTILFLVGIMFMVLATVYLGG